MELQGRVKQLQSEGLGLAVISYDTREIMAAFSTQFGITFPMLADPGSPTITRYGLLNTLVADALGPDKDDPVVKAEVAKYISGVNPRAAMQGMAFPGTFIVDRQGRVTSRFFEDFYIERSTTASVLKRLGLGGETVAGTTVSTQHLELTGYPSDAAVAPGNRFSVVLDITPKRGMHLYAPGATGYRVVKFTIADQPLVRVLAPTFPPSEIYYFKPLDERVPVYMKPFTLVQEVVLDGDPKAQAALRERETLTINATLEYQACDDKLCYNPVSLPLSWTLNLRSIIRQ